MSQLGVRNVDISHSLIELIETFKCVQVVIIGVLIALRLLKYIAVLCKFIAPNICIILVNISDFND